jgi:hypothetical protein
MRGGSAEQRSVSAPPLPKQEGHQRSQQRFELAVHCAGLLSINLPTVGYCARPPNRAKLVSASSLSPPSPAGPRDPRGFFFLARSGPNGLSLEAEKTAVRLR